MQRIDFMIWWCEQHHGSFHLLEMLSLEINEGTHQIRFFGRFFFTYFEKKIRKILLTVDWPKNKVAQTLLVKQEMKPQGLICPKNKL